MSQPVSDNGTTFPIPEGAFIATLRALLAARGQVNAADVLAAGKVTVEHRGWDNLDGGIDYWGVDVALPVATYAKYGPTTRDAIEKTISNAMDEVMRGHEAARASGAIIKPLIGTDLTLVKTDITNQGRGYAAKPAHIEHDGLRFRSHAEARLFKALRNLKVLVAPLPVFVVGTQIRREPDFFIVKDGDTMLVEVDGPDTHPERAVEAERRLTPFKDEGVHIERVSTAECDSDADAERCAQRLVAKFERYRNHR